MNLKDAGIYDLINIFKGESTNAHGVSQGGIINTDSRVINIPAYQRPYRWQPENIMRLFEDYDDNRESEYFLGSAVFVEKRKKDNALEFDVVDGQQRLTTLYLLNYVRFLLKKEYALEKLKKPYQPKASEFCNELKKCYVNLIGKNSVPFDNILEKINELMDDEDLDPNERVQQLVDCYKKELCISENKNAAEDTIRERELQIKKFFEDEQLCLKYSRKRYDSVLKNALCKVHLEKLQNTTNFVMKISMNSDGEDPFEKNYIDALQTIFSEIWKRAIEKTNNIETAKIIDITENAIKLADEIVRNMSICIVLTESENDANKLFEVLNDRALEVEDLELIKNHFYKEYCTKSSDTDEQKDKRISELEELWTDKIFSGNGEFKKKLISYLSAVYLTCDTDLGYKEETKLKDAIDKKYSACVYPAGEKEYTYDNILEDFNAYYAIKIILDTFEVKVNKLNEVSLKAEQENKSITYKAFHLLNAMKLHAVIPALTNVIISSYAQKHNLNDEHFEIEFKKFITELMYDKNHENYEVIHKCAHMLWTAAIKGKNYVLPRNIAKRIIGKYGHGKFSKDNMGFFDEEVAILNEEFNDWLNDWRFNSGKSFVIKILMLNLLLCDRKINENEKGYKASKVQLIANSALAYKLEASDLQLDHLEANVIGGDPSNYYMSSDLEKRQKDVNEYIGNFMILDAKDNNQKNNVPLYRAMKYYSKIEKSWMVQDIKDMLCDSYYYNDKEKELKEEFFKDRSQRLKKYFKGYLNRQFKQEEIEIEF